MKSMPSNFDFDDPGWAKISSDGRELVKTRSARCARPALIYSVLQHRSTPRTSTSPSIRRESRGYGLQTSTRP